MACKFITYLRVSTRKQGDSGLGLEDQRATVEAYARANGCRILAEHVEAESGRKSDKERPQLAAAIALARQTGAVLLIARLNRLLRSVDLLVKLREAKVAFRCCDMPDANEMTITIMAAVAEQEAKNISRDTKAALAVAKRNGPKPGKKPIGSPYGFTRSGPACATAYKLANARNRQIADAHAAALAPMVADIRAKGIVSVRGIAAELTARDAQTMSPHLQRSRRGSWSTSNTANLLKRIKRLPQTAA